MERWGVWCVFIVTADAEWMSDDELDDFCEREFPRPVALLRLYCGDEWLAQELAQEALARAVTNWPRIRRLEAASGSTYRVAINLANSRSRRRKVARNARLRLQTQGTSV